MTEEPRCVYLDVNHWIALAKQRKTGDLILEQRLAVLVRDNKIMVPFSAIHIMEIAAVLKDRQRHDLSSMLCGLSHGLVMRSMKDVRYLEVATGVAAHYSVFCDTDVRSRALTRGYLQAFGEPMAHLYTFRKRTETYGTTVFSGLIDLLTHLESEKETCNMGRTGGVPLDRYRTATNH